VSWIWWVAIGFVLGLNFGVAISGVLRFSSKHHKREALRNLLSGSALEGPSTVF
jgi:hypothetical protein